VKGLHRQPIEGTPDGWRHYVTSLADTIAALKAVTETQAEAIAQLKANLAPRQGFQAIGRFSPQEEIVLAAILRFDMATFEQIYQGLYAGRYGRDTPDNSIVKVHVCRIRHKLSPYGIAIESWYGRGYRMGPDSKARLRALIDRASTPLRDEGTD
jgi:hypothetical protein